MFNGLKNTAGFSAAQVQQNTPTKATYQSSTTLASVARQGLVAKYLAHLTAAHARMSGNISQMKLLRRSTAVLNTYGMSRSLMALMNSDGSLTHLANAPATESLNNVPMPTTSQRHRLVIQNLKLVLAQENQGVVDYLNDAHDDVDDIITDARDQAEELIKSAEDILEHLQDAEIGDDVLTGVVVKTIPAARRKDLLEKIRSQLTEMGVPEPERLKEEEYVDAADDGAKELVDSVGDGLGLDHTDGEITEGDVRGDFVDQEGSLASLGYTVEATVELVNLVKSVAEAILALHGQKEEVLGAIKEAADTVPEVVEPAQEDEGGADPAPEPTEALDDHRRVMSNYCTALCHLVHGGLEHGVQTLAIAEELVRQAQAEPADPEDNTGDDL